MKRLWLALVCSAALAQAPAVDRVAEFEDRWFRFISALYGCEGRGRVCNPALGRWDAKRFHSARESAKVLFGFD